MSIIRAKTWLASIAFHPLVGTLLALVFKGRLPVRGALVDVKSSGIKPEYKAAIFWRRYEHTELRFIRQYLRRDLDIVELGSSIGVVTAHLAALLATDRKMVCVEPNGNLIDSIVANARMNGEGKEIVIHNAAIAYASKVSSSRARIPCGALWLRKATVLR